MAYSFTQRGPTMMLKKGFLVAFEGIDGAGQTTQANLLHQYLINKRLKDRKNSPK
jgi:adenylylsulfate kinase-like enzyme